ncbi:MAG: hypothetical protein P4L82_07095 [Ancalomicrobiaceae bacterium]|nr:hypothetical protein [Ancalomicrobiaceae bacterium]
MESFCEAERATLDDEAAVEAAVEWALDRCSSTTEAWRLLAAWYRVDLDLLADVLARKVAVN